MRHYCVISHTHWDREWYQTQEEFRMRLVDLFDHLLHILDTDPEFVFHMDAQTVVFEDYWEIRPEEKEKCCRYIREGRILTGPWYVQNDFFLTSGEATVRNLLLGTKQAEEMGRCAQTGYAPDQFGLISQLPQILQGFGLDHCVFGRGDDEYTREADGTLKKKKKPSEFIWRSPDGSEVLAICMRFWYNNAQRFSADIDRALRLTESVRDSFEGVATTPYLLLMNGVDHLEPQPDLLPVLREVQARLPEDEKIYQTTLEEYAKLIKCAKAKEEMKIKEGELMLGADCNLLKDTVSSRIYLKIKNSELQNLLENRLEPLYSMLELYGMKGIYPAAYLNYLWKMLIRNHAHDSICGCSKDAVHNHMEDRFAAISEVGEELQRRGLKELAAHVSRGFEQDDYQIVVFNGLEHARTETIDVSVDVIAADEPKGLHITDPDGKEIPFVILRQYTLAKSVFSPINLPGRLDTVRYEIRMLAEQIPAFGYCVYRVQVDQETRECTDQNSILSLKDGNCFLENEHLKVTVTPSGCIDLFHKESAQNYHDILTVQDVADIGNAYCFLPLPGDVPVELAQFTPEMTVEESDAFSAKLRLHYDIALPAYYDAAKEKRSIETVTMALDILLGLTKNSEQLTICFQLDNRAKDHRMRALIRTGISSDVVTASAPYDLVTRNKWDIDTGVCNETEHTSGMVTICDSQRTVSVLNRGIFGYEHLQKEQGTLAFTIVRATGEINGGVVSDDEAWKVPGNQCLRKIQCEIAVLPQCGDNCAQRAAFAAKAFQNPLLVQCEPVDTRKFTGGRPAVQDTEIAELFYQDLKYAEVQLEPKCSGFLLEGTGLQVTALKQTCVGQDYILRFYNMKESAVDAVLHLAGFAIEKVYQTNLKETAREELSVTHGQVRLQVKPKEIVTLLLERKREKQ